MGYDYAEGSSLDQTYQYLPPIKVSFGFSHVPGISGIRPSPDWFSGFYDMETIDEYSGVFWETSKLHTYPWDAGTDDGATYAAANLTLSRTDPVRRFAPETVPNEVFVSPTGYEIRPVAEWECFCTCVHWKIPAA